MNPEIKFILSIFLNKCDDPCVDLYQEIKRGVFENEKQRVLIYFKAVWIMFKEFQMHRRRYSFHARWTVLLLFLIMFMVYFVFIYPRYEDVYRMSMMFFTCCSGLILLFYEYLRRKKNTASQMEEKINTTVMDSL